MTGKSVAFEFSVKLESVERLIFLEGEKLEKPGEKPQEQGHYTKQ